jgi:hypothetical protein
VVVGAPFFFKAGRMAWCAAWASLLYTWNVARGFTRDSLERPLLLPTSLLFFPEDESGDADPTANIVAGFANADPSLQ